jgi:hypothetical protein
MGVDVARSGSNKSVLFFRQGRDARSIPPVIYRGSDTMVLADIIATNIEKFDRVDRQQGLHPQPLYYQCSYYSKSN